MKRLGILFLALSIAPHSFGATFTGYGFGGVNSSRVGGRSTIRGYGAGGVNSTSGRSGKIVGYGANGVQSGGRRFVIVASRNTGIQGSPRSSVRAPKQQGILAAAKNKQTRLAGAPRVARTNPPSYGTGGINRSSRSR